MGWQKVAWLLLSCLHLLLCSNELERVPWACLPVYCHAVRNSTGRRGRTSDERRLAIPYTETYYPVLVYTVAEIRLLV
jgi:hypothetical protein